MATYTVPFWISIILSILCVFILYLIVPNLTWVHVLGFVVVMMTLSNLLVIKQETPEIKIRKDQTPGDIIKMFGKSTTTTKIGSPFLFWLIIALIIIYGIPYKNVQ